MHTLGCPVRSPLKKYVEPMPLPNSLSEAPWSPPCWVMQRFFLATGAAEANSLRFPASAAPLPSAVDFLSA